MKRVRIFNPLHVLGNKISVSGIIKPLVDRKDGKWKDTFDMADW
jgi:hypothetical protein